jgi:hypothetical protein
MWQKNCYANTVAQKVKLAIVNLLFNSCFY